MRTYHKDNNADFTCKYCGWTVSTRAEISGVTNRNHCPFCLHSRHVDLFNPGDRLCACKGLMAPVGLTLKETRDKYAAQTNGELMLVHRCNACGAISINRIAADDDAAMLLAILGDNLEEQPVLSERCKTSGIQLLRDNHCYLVYTQLFGGVTLPRPAAAVI